MIDDEKQQELAITIRSLSQVFCAKLPDTMTLLETELNLIVQRQQNRTSWETLQRELHGIAGSAGTFGFHELGKRAKDLELRINGLLNSEENCAERCGEFIRDQQQFIHWVRENYVQA